MTPSTDDALRALASVRTHFESRGLCHILEMRGACECPLCLIDLIRSALASAPTGEMIREAKAAELEAAALDISRNVPRGRATSAHDNGVSVTASWVRERLAARAASIRQGGTP